MLTEETSLLSEHLVDPPNDSPKHTPKDLAGATCSKAFLFIGAFLLRLRVFLVVFDFDTIMFILFWILLIATALRISSGSHGLWPIRLLFLCCSARAVGLDFGALNVTGLATADLGA